MWGRPVLPFAVCPLGDSEFLKDGGVVVSGSEGCDAIGVFGACTRGGGLGGRPFGGGQAESGAL